MRCYPWTSLALLLTVFLAPILSAEILSAEIREPEETPKTPFDHLEWRNIGPVNMTGRVTDVEGVPGDPNVIWVGAASGGVWKSTNGGHSFKPVFDDQDIASIGDLALAPSNPDVVYVGTGEANTRNSVSYGNGVYRTTDGGETWTHLGLEGTRHISRIVVSPSDPNKVWVGAVGHIFGPHEERGVFRTEDGGATWEKVLYLDERHGASDLDLDAKNPNILFAGLWYFDRKPWNHTSGSEEGGVYRSVDGGTTWNKVTEGLPKLMGRIGVKIAPSNPEVVYVIAESNEGVLFRSDDRGRTFRQVSDNVSLVSRGLYYTDMRVDPTDENHVFAISSRLFRSIDGGKNFDRISRATHGDYHSLWIDPEDPRRIWQGQDGGIAVSYDRGTTWDAIRNIPIGQFYQVFHDDRKPFYYLGGGLQDNGTWYGPSRTRGSGILTDHWRTISGGDAYFVVPHPTQEQLFLTEYQGGGILRTDFKAHVQIDVNPQPRRNDGGPVGELTYRFNWNAPIILSPHDPSKVYFAGNVVFQTSDFGDTWKKISGDLTTNDPEKIGEAGGPVWYENTTAEYHCTIISFAESPAEAGVLWAGTDDGNLQISRDGGGSWTNVIRNVPEIPKFSPVSHIEPSRHGGGVAYASFDRHMFDDPAPHIFKTMDYGATWKRLSADFEPASYVWVVREDPKNPDLVYAGTELGLFVSHNGGTGWRRLRLANLPTVAIHDILIHPGENDLILGTHGRAIWLFDDATPIQQWSEDLGEKKAHLFPIRPAIRFGFASVGFGLGDKVHQAPNPPSGALITYHLQEDLAAKEDKKDATEKDAIEKNTKDEDRIKIEILDDAGEIVRTLEEVGMKAGLNRVAWDLSSEPPRQRRDGPPEGGGFFGPPTGPAALPGTYTVRLTVDGESSEERVEVGLDPTIETSVRELAWAHEAAMELREMVSEVSDTLRAIDAVSAQLGERRKLAGTVKIELPTELEETWKSHDEKLEKILGRLTRPEGKTFWSQGPRHDERVTGLMFELGYALAAPTAAQMDYLAELKAEHKEKIGAWRTHLAETLPALSEGLIAAGLPGLLLPAEIGDGDKSEQNT